MKRPLTRLLALAGSIALGTAGALVLASPAQAHHTTIEGKANCLPSGKYEITWTVANGNWSDRYAQVVGDPVADPNDPLDGISDGTVIKADKKATAKQLVNGDTKSASLTVKANWFDAGSSEVKETMTNIGWAQMRDGSPLDGKCAPKPTCVDAASAKYQHTFNGPQGKATVRLTGDLPLCQGQSQDFLLVSYYAPNGTFSVPQYAFDDEVKTITDQVREVELDVDIPPCWTQVDLVWGKGLIDPLVANGPRYGDKKLGSPKAPGNRSQGPKGWYNGAGTEGRQCTTPAATFVSSCDGSVTVHLSNTGKYDATFKVTANGVDKTEVVAPGKAKDVVIPAGAGQITVTEQGKEVGKYSWARPADCPLPKLVVQSTCDKFILKISNPKNNQPLTAKATYGSQTKTVTVNPGTTETVTFDAGSAPTAKVTFNGYDFELEGQYVKPATCATLPTTGSSTGSFMLWGSVLVLLGGVVFMMARRRLVYLRNLAR